MKTKLSLLLILFALSSCCNKTSIESQLSDKFTTYNEYSESFETLADFVKDKRIVILGECGHGDGRTNDMQKNRPCGMRSISRLIFAYH